MLAEQQRGIAVEHRNARRVAFHAALNGGYDPLHQRCLLIRPDQHLRRMAGGIQLDPNHEPVFHSASSQSVVFLSVCGMNTRNTRVYKQIGRLIQDSSAQKAYPASPPEKGPAAEAAARADSAAPPSAAPRTIRGAFIISYPSQIHSIFIIEDKAYYSSKNGLFCRFALRMGRNVL